VPPDDDDPDPEILYAIDRRHRGVGLAGEAAAAAISWLFEHTACQGVTAVIFTRLNPGSVAVVSKLGLGYRRRMDFSLFMNDSELADEVAEYEIWRLAREPAEDLDRLVEQCAFRAGQLATVTAMPGAEILRALSNSRAGRCAAASLEAELPRLQAAVEQAFASGGQQAYMDCYHLSRAQWLAGNAGRAAPAPRAGES